MWMIQDRFRSCFSLTSCWKSSISRSLKCVPQCSFVTVLIFISHCFKVMIYPRITYVYLLEVGRASEGPHCLLFQWLGTEKTNPFKLVILWVTNLIYGISFLRSQKSSIWKGLTGVLVLPLTLVSSMLLSKALNLPGT